jgi:hypothetical protein
VKVSQVKDASRGGRHPFDRWLASPAERLSEVLLNPPLLPWVEFWLNPRRLRGSDFLMRWSQGVWSEQRLVEAVAATGRFFALPYGPSGTAPSNDVRAFELYFERLEQAGLGDLKRPDLLIFSVDCREEVREITTELGGLTELPFTSEENPAMQRLLTRACLAVECENSLWRASRMPDFGKPLTPQRRLGGRPGLRKNAVLPTIIVKEEDREPLCAWQTRRGVPVHIWHVFFDLAYGLALDRAEELIAQGLTEPTIQVFQAPGGATTRKTIYKHYYHHGYLVGRSVAEPELAPAFIEDGNGHILPYVTFRGGRLELTPEAVQLLERPRA